MIRERFSYRETIASILADTPEHIESGKVGDAGSATGAGSIHSP